MRCHKMDFVYQMANTNRHLELASGLSTSIVYRYWDLIRSKKIRIFQESAALSHYGKLGQFAQLIDIRSDEYLKCEEDLSSFSYVQPDFMLFKENPFAMNKAGTRFAGFPDLIIEIWSVSNTHFERDAKRNLYSTSSITEHWYISQESDIVVCYNGSTKLKDKTLTEPMITLKGLEIDLTWV